MRTVPITVVELAAFVRQAESVWTNDERTAFIDFIARQPDVGRVIPETGGVRKVRWSRAGIGKRGGVRVIYYVMDTNHPVVLITVYAKARREDLSQSDKRILRALTREFKREYRRRADEEAL